MSLTGKLVIAYLAIVFISIQVYKKRAGLPIMGSFHLFGQGGLGPIWLLWSLIKAFTWPLILVLWLVTGCPQPRKKYVPY